MSVFENPNSTPDHQRVGESGEILRVLVGSGVHGTAVDGQDDRNEMGICIEPPEYVCGLETFEQYIFRTHCLRMAHPWRILVLPRASALGSGPGCLPEG